MINGTGVWEGQITEFWQPDFSRGCSSTCTASRWRTVSATVLSRSGPRTPLRSKKDSTCAQHPALHTQAAVRINAVVSLALGALASNDHVRQTNTDRQGWPESLLRDERYGTREAVESPAAWIQTLVESLKPLQASGRDGPKTSPARVPPARRSLPRDPL